MLLLLLMLMLYCHCENSSPLHMFDWTQHICPHAVCRSGAAFVWFEAGCIRRRHSQPCECVRVCKQVEKMNSRSHLHEELLSLYGACVLSDCVIWLIIHLLTHFRFQQNIKCRAFPAFCSWRILWTRACHWTPRAPTAATLCSSSAAAQTATRPASLTRRCCCLLIVVLAECAVVGALLLACYYCYCYCYWWRRHYDCLCCCCCFVGVIDICSGFLLAGCKGRAKRDERKNTHVF